MPILSLISILINLTRNSQIFNSFISCIKPVPSQSVYDLSYRHIVSAGQGLLRRNIGEIDANYIMKNFVHLDINVLC